MFNFIDLFGQVVFKFQKFIGQYVVCGIVELYYLWKIIELGVIGLELLLNYVVFVVDICKWGEVGMLLLYNVRCVFNWVVVIDEEGMFMFFEFDEVVYVVVNGLLVKGVCVGEGVVILVCNYCWFVIVNYGVV